MPPFLRLQGRVAAVAAEVGAVAKRIEKALVKPFCEKKLHRIFVRLEKMAEREGNSAIFIKTT